MKPRFFIRTDGDFQIGFGHLSRCMALAEVLKQIGTVHFLLSASSAETAFSLGISHPTLVPEAFSSDSAGFLLPLLTPGDWVVIDHYGLGQDYLNVLHRAGIGTVQINDLPEQALNATAVLNHCPFLKTSDFTPFKLSPRHWLLGLDWLMLRPPFPELMASPPKVGEGLFLCFGGSQAASQLNTCLEWLHTLRYPGLVRAICPNLEAFAFLEHRFPSLRLSLSYQQPAHAMAALMRDSAVAVVPSSTLALEALCAGLPLITGILADNQRYLHRGLVKFSGVIGLGHWKEKGLNDFSNALQLLEGTSKPYRILPKPWQNIPEWLKHPFAHE